MRRKNIIGKLVIFGALSSLFLACEPKDPSIAKIYVRSASNELLPDAMVVLIADIDNNTVNLEYVDTIFTNSSGYAEFVLDEYFKSVGKDVSTANFDIVAKKSGSEGNGEIRTRIHTVSVQTVKLVN
jgi:hypothetical protein